MRRLAFLTVVLLPVLGVARLAWAEPAWGVNCLSCHGEMPIDLLVVIGEDTMADPDETNTGAPDRGLLKVFDAYRGAVKTLQAEVVGLGTGDRYAVQLKRLRYPGVEAGADLTYTPDCAWAYWGSPGKYFTDPEVGYRGESGPSIFSYDIGVDMGIPDDYFDLVFAVAGVFDDGVLFYAEEHFYIHVSRLPGDMDGDGDVDNDDYALFVPCYTGPDGGPVGPGCEPGDFDGDDDIDCFDWDAFVLAWTEPGDPPVFAQCTVVAPASPPAPHDVPKNRYLTIDPTTNLREVAYRVELTESAPYPTAIGRAWWLDTPVCRDLNGNACPGVDCVLDPVPPDCDGPYVFGWTSTLTSMPVTREWVESPVHFTGCGVVPVASYEVRSSGNEGGLFSDPLEVVTAHKPDGTAQSWGDVTGGPDPVNPGDWLPPEGAMNMGDIGNSIRTFENRTEGTGFPPRVWVDVENNHVVNLGDIQFLVMAFEGRAYADIEDLDYIGWHPADCP